METGQERQSRMKIYEKAKRNKEEEKKLETRYSKHKITASFTFHTRKFKFLIWCQ